MSASLLGVPAHTDRLAIHLQTSLHLPALPSARFVDPASVSTRDCTWHRVDDAWLDTFESMRTRVLAEIARRRVIIESCPSSNLAVLGLKHAPIRRFLTDHGVTCAIATDDPGLLDAWPRRELADHVRADKRERVLHANRQASFIRRREPRALGGGIDVGED